MPTTHPAITDMPASDLTIGNRIAIDGLLYEVRRIERYGDNRTLTIARPTSPGYLFLWSCDADQMLEVQV